VKLLPEFVALYALLGNLQLADGHLAEAQRYYEQALAIQPDFAVAASNLAWTLAKRGKDLDRAAQLAQKARQLMPQMDSIADTLAWVEYEKGEYRSALPLLQECIQKSPANSVYHYHLGMVLIATGEKQKAREELRSALRLKLPSDDADSATEVLARLQ
jgi:Flp pilus assembly protein TadD